MAAEDDRSNVVQISLISFTDPNSDVNPAPNFVRDPAWLKILVFRLKSAYHAGLGGLPRCITVLCL